MNAVPHQVFDPAHRSCSLEVARLCCATWLSVRMASKLLLRAAKQLAQLRTKPSRWKLYCYEVDCVRILQGTVCVDTTKPGCHENVQVSERGPLKYYGNRRIEFEGRSGSRDFRLCSRIMAFVRAFAPKKKQFLQFLATREGMQQHLDSVR